MQPLIYPQITFLLFLQTSLLLCTNFAVEWAFEAGTDFTDFLVRQSIVPSAMLVMANKMAKTMNTIATIIQVIFGASLSTSCSKVDEVHVGVCAAEAFTILRKKYVHIYAIDDTKQKANLIPTFITGHELMVTVLIVWNKWVQVLPVQCKKEQTVDCKLELTLC